MLKKEDYRFVLQRCTVCGAEFPVIYQYNEKGIASFGFACRHVPYEGATCVPVGEQPTFNEWYDQQSRIRALLASRY